MNTSRILSEIVALTTDAVVVVDEMWGIVFFNPGAERIFERSAAEVRGEPVDLLLPEGFGEEPREPVRPFEDESVLAQWRSECVEIPGRRRTGEIFPAEASISRLEVDGRRLYAAVLRDVSERKRAEAELLRSREALVEAQRLAHLGSWELVPNTDEVRWSEELQCVFGLEPTDDPLSFASILECLHPEDRERVRALVADALREGTEFEDEHGVVRPDGSVRTIHSRGRVHLDADGKPARMVGTAQDVTERKQAEARERALLHEQAAREAAETAAARSRFLAEAGEILSSSLEVEETLRSVARLAVPRIADWCALDRLEPSGRRRRVELAYADAEAEPLARAALLHEAPDPARTNPYTADVLRGEPILVPEVTDAFLAEMARDESQLAVLRRLGIRSGMAVPMRAHGRVLGLITLATGSSGRRLGEDDLSLALELGSRAGLALENARLFEEARASARAREEAVATVSHDLRSPLGVVTASAALLRDPEVGTELREAAIHKIERSGEAMRRMIDRFLDVTRLEGGAVGLETGPVDVGTLLEEACSLVEPTAAAGRVRLAPRGTPGLRMQADRDRVVQVLVNLLENAVHHSPETGTVTLAARPLGGHVLLSVADEGPGVPAELHGQIFERFWRRDRRRRGSGLGLAIARGLVELHGGQIWVESPEGGGARFCVAFPAEPEGG